MSHLLQLTRQGPQSLMLVSQVSAFCLRVVMHRTEWQHTDKEALQIDAVDVASLTVALGINERRRQVRHIMPACITGTESI